MNSARYIRQIILKDFGEDSQRKLNKSRVLVIGAGGLGIPVLQYLTSMGVGCIGIVEDDIIELSNLHRQVIYKEGDIGKSKLNKALTYLKSLNSEIQLNPYKTFLSIDNALDIISKYDIVVDTSDNFPTRYLTNDACVILQKPLVYGALHGFEGHVSVLNYKKGPTYRCLFPNPPENDEIRNCNENGILGILPGIVGCLQGLEVIKVITDIGDPLSGKLLIYDGLHQEINKIAFPLIDKNAAISTLKDSYGQLPCNIDETISAHDFLKDIETDENNQIIDVRSEMEFHENSLKNSINIPVDKLANYPKSNTFEIEKIYLLCQSGQRSKKGAAILKSRFPNKRFINVEGGHNAISALSIKTQ